MRGSMVRRVGGVSPVAYRYLLQALNTCGITYAGVLPAAPTDALFRSTAAPFAPLFTTHFDAHQHQLTTLGDAIIDAYLSQAVLRYCARRGTTLTTNAAGELNAVLHNHFTLRLFAKELQFEAMAMTRGDASASDPAAQLGFLEAERHTVRKQDVVGTSYQVGLLPSAQSPLGWKFSQFVGAVHQTLGADSATQALERVYQLQGEPNVPHRASSLLLRVLEHFPALNVAEALLAAQGLSVHYTARSRLIPDAAVPRAQDSESPSPSPTAHRMQGETDSQGAGDADALAIVSGFRPGTDGAADITLDSLETQSPDAQGLAAGPGLIDAVDMWRRRTRDLVERGLEPATTDAAASGWLTAEEQAAYRRGPAFAAWVDVAATPCFADVYGAPQPVDGRVVRRTRFKKPVRDPRFFDTMSDARNGVPFDTNGEPVAAYLDAFAKPHQRLFEVTMHSGAGGELRHVGRAIASRYTTARESACRAFLGGVLHDILSIGGGSLRHPGGGATPQ